MTLALLGPEGARGQSWCFELSHLAQTALELALPQSLLGKNLQDMPWSLLCSFALQVPGQHQVTLLFTDKSLEQRLKEVEEECKKKESRRVDLELSLVEVKENLKKAESGPVTLGTAVDTTHLENAAPRVWWGAPLECTGLSSSWAVALARPA